MAARYLNLSAGAWAGMRRAWRLPMTPALFAQAWLLGPVRSALAWLQNLVVGRQPVRDMEAIFILGFWRSGTTLLHELLCAGDEFSFPTTYACLHPHHFVFSRKFAAAGTMRRPQDRMAVGWQTPQEDEFALLGLGARSPYEGLIAADRFGEALKLSDPRDLPAKDARAWEKCLLNFLSAVFFAGGGKPLILKSPSHSYRAVTLRRLFPKARFILIVRDPFEVAESLMKTYRAYSLQFGLTPGLSNRDLRQVILEERLRCEEKLREGLAGLAPDRLVVVKYEELKTDPLAVVETVHRHFHLPGMAAIRARAVRPRTDAPIRPAAQPAPAWKEKLRLAWAEIFALYGYDRAPQAPPAPPVQAPSHDTILQGSPP